MNKIEKFTDLVGHTLSAVEIDKYYEYIIFTLDNGDKYKMYHSQDCCESVTLDDICGDIHDLIGTPILSADEFTSNDPIEGQESVESFTWTFYHIATFKGTVSLRWFGTSNGYYSESVDFVQLITKRTL